MNTVIFTIAFLLVGCSIDTTVKVQLNESESGHYFIIWTSDTSKYSNDIAKPIKFDRNKVVYLNYRLRGSIGIKPLNYKGNDVSKRLKRFVGNEFYMDFYNPTDKEYYEHPNWDTFYLNKRPNKAKDELQAKGYKFEDEVIKQELIKLKKYQTSG